MSHLNLTKNYDVGLRNYMLSVYNYMGIGLLLSMATAFLTNSIFMDVFFTSENGKIAPNGLGWITILAPLGIILAMSFMRNLSTGTTKLLYWLFVVCQGVGFSVLLRKYTGADLTVAFTATSAAFFGLSLYGYTTKRDLSGMGKFLFMALIGLIVVIILAMIFPTSFSTTMISLFGVLIFAGLTAYDTQSIKESYLQGYGDEKTAIMGAVNLYLNFINLFQFILALVGSNDD